MVYDPNFPGETKILKADPTNYIYYYKGDHDNKNCQWQTYFVNKKYNFSTPPATTPEPTKKVPGLISDVLLEIQTGGDDLRGGNDNVNATFRFRGKPDQVFLNINKGARWINNYTQTVPIHFTTPVNREDLASILFSTTFGGGMGGDNWNMDRVKLIIGGAVIVEKSGTPLNRFTGDRKFYTLIIP